MTSETTTQIELQILELESKAQKKKDRFEKEYAKLTKEIEKLREQVVPKLPPELEGHFGPFTQVLGSDDVPTAWGYRPRGHLPEDIWSAASKVGNWECIEMGRWVLVVKRLAPQEAVIKYGPVTEVHEGPSGGWRHATYGKTEFYEREMDPRGVVPHPTPIREQRHNYRR